MRLEKISEIEFASVDGVGSHVIDVEEDLRLKTRRAPSKMPDAAGSSPSPSRLVIPDGILACDREHRAIVSHLDQAQFGEL